MVDYLLNRLRISVNSFNHITQHNRIWFSGFEALMSPSIQHVFMSTRLTKQYPITTFNEVRFLRCDSVRSTRMLSVPIRLCFMRGFYIKLRREKQQRIFLLNWNNFFYWKEYHESAFTEHSNVSYGFLIELDDAYIMLDIIMFLIEILWENNRTRYKQIQNMSKNLFRKQSEKKKYSI